jgi:octanoyl-[GcvH]:protein N-octanoyltransferase
VAAGLVVRLISDGDVVDPVWDSAVSRALMLRVAGGELPETLRVSRPGAAVAFGKRDVVSEGYAAAVEAALAGGFEVVERLAGGRAAVFHEGTLHFGHAVRDGEPRLKVTRRFEEAAALVARALGRLGVDARVGEIPGEYCPGEHGSYTGGVVVVEGADRIREVLLPVYEALGLSWLPETTGAVADERPGVTWEDVQAAIETEYAAAYDLEPAELDTETLALARRLAPEHRSPG